VEHYPALQTFIESWGVVVHVPALVVLSLWIVLQFINGIGSVARPDETAGIAYMAHIGGFVADSRSSSCLPAERTGALVS
jgi:membrane associated rhomboid family serine protease